MSTTFKVHPCSRYISVVTVFASTAIGPGFKPRLGHCLNSLSQNQPDTTLADNFAKC